MQIGSLSNWMKNIEWKQLFHSAVTRYRSWNLIKKIAFWIASIIALHWLYILVLIFVFPPITMTQLDGLINSKSFYRDYVDREDISKYAKLAVIGAEDQLFAEHFGFDMESIEKALEYNAKKKGKKMRGASTISQQVAKNVFLWQGRSWVRKGLEVYFTFMIELLWSKKRILEMYLNVIEMGDGIYGIEAASQYYFHKPAIKLSPTQAAQIAAALPNPKRYKVVPTSTWVNLRTPWIIDQMDHLIYEESVAELILD